MKVVCKDNQDGDAADGIELRNFLSHGRCRPLNVGREPDAKLLAYGSIVREAKGQIRRKEARLERQGPLTNLRA